MVERDMGAVINDQRIAMTAGDNFDPDSSPLDDYYNDYRSYSTQVKFMYRLARERPDITNVLKIGRSFEGREMYVLQIAEAPGKPMSYNQVS